MLKVERLFLRYKDRINSILDILKLFCIYFQILFVGFSTIHFFLKSVGDVRNVDILKFLNLIWFIVCYALWAVARIQLGDQFTFLPSDSEELIKTGLYSKISCPIYVFGTLGFISFVILVDRPKLLLLLLVLVPIQMYRAKLEGQTLKEKHGEAYDLYIAQTWI